MKPTYTIAFLSVTIALCICGCGGDGPQTSDQEFRLIDVSAEDLRKVGEEKKFLGDSTVSLRESDSVPSPDGSKVAYCERGRVFVADSDNSSRKLLYDEGRAGGLVCFNLQWSSDGKELSFIHVLESDSNDVTAVNVFITLDRSSVSE